MEKPSVLTYDDLKKLTEESGKPYDMEKIERAYEMARNAHQDQRRLSGELYISHPIAVACLVVNLGLDTDSVIAALLHDVVEDTGLSLDTLRQNFGADVVLLVDGVTKLGKIKFSSMEEQQAENLRKMLMAMSKDVRVMLVKLCDLSLIHIYRPCGILPVPSKATLHLC